MARRRCKRPVPGIAALTLGWLLASGTAGRAEEWSRFRGPNGSGVAIPQADPPVVFGDNANLAWRTPLPAGHSSPVLAPGRIFLTALDGEELVTLCLDRRSGQVLWRRTAPRPRRDRLHKLNHPASPSPATDDSSVYVFFPEFGLLSYSFEGVERWRVPLGPFSNVYGMGASPILAGDSVVLVCDQSRDSFIAAFDRSDGALRWRAARPDAISGHSTPILFRGLILAPGSFRLDAYEAATGRVDWSYDGLPSEMKSVPVADGETVYIHGYNTPENDAGRLIAVPPFPDSGRLSREQAPTEHSRRYFTVFDLNQDGFLDAAEWAAYQRTMGAENALLALDYGKGARWKYHRSIPQLPSPLLYRGVLYMINESGVLTTLEAASGRLLKQARLRGVSDTYYASPVAAAGRVYIASYSGVVSVLEAGGEQRELAVNDLAEETLATPAVAEDGLWIRTAAALYCFRSAGAP